MSEGGDGIVLPARPGLSDISPAAAQTAASHECGALTAAGGWCKHPKPIQAANARQGIGTDGASDGLATILDDSCCARPICLPSTAGATRLASCCI